MTWTPVTDAMAVYLVDGEDLTLLPVVPGSLSVEGNIGDLCRVCSFALAGQPSPRPQRGDTILVRYLDADDSLMYDVFGGRLNRPDTDSDPFQMVFTASDQLEKLRRTKRGGDMALSGSGRTEGDAVELILDYCGVTYDGADIADSGYVIGLEEPISWLDDGSTSAASMLGDLDRVFGMKTMTVGNDRVVRIPYDPTPTTSTGAHRTLAKGSTADWQQHHRGGGTRDDVVNVWQVTGAQIQVSDQCSATVWSKAVDSVTELGPGVKAADGTFQSDLIQSEDLAEAIARRQMRMFNRVPEIGSATIRSDPNVYPGTKFALHDTTYGIGADPRYATVASYRWTYPTLDFDFVSGPAGDEGTVTSGVDKVCNDSHSDLPIPGSGFDFPPFDVPPIDAGTLLDFTPPDLAIPWPATGLLAVRAIPPGGTYAGSVSVGLVPTFVCIVYYTDDGSTPTTASTMFTTDVVLTETTTLKFFGRQNAEHVSPVATEVYTITGGGGGGGLTCDTPLGADWVVDSGSMGDFVLGDGLVQNENAGSVHASAMPVSAGGSWELRTTVTASDKNTVQVGVASDGLSFEYVLFVYATDESINGIQLSTLIDDQYDTTDQSGAAVDVVLRYDAPSQTLTARVGTVTLIASDVDSGVAGTLYPIVRVYDLGGNPLSNGEAADIEFCLGGEGEVLSPADWTALAGSPSITGDDAVHFTTTPDGDAYAAGHVFDGTERARLAGHADFGGSDESNFQFVLADTEGANTGNFAGIEAIIGASPALNVYTWDGFVTDLGTDLSGLSAGCDVAIDWNPEADLFSFLITDSSDGSTLASGAWPLGAWPGDMTVHLAHGSAVAMDWDTTGLAVRAG